MSQPTETFRRDPPSGRPALTDSPWFWLLVFANAGLVGVMLIGPKYNRRQGAIERRYEARQEIARQMQNRPEGADSSAVGPAAEVPVDEYSLPDNSAHLVPLGPLVVALVLLNSAAIVLFCVSRLRLASHLRTKSNPPKL